MTDEKPPECPHVSYVDSNIRVGGPHGWEPVSKSRRCLDCGKVLAHHEYPKHKPLPFSAFAVVKLGY